MKKSDISCIFGYIRLSGANEFPGHIESFEPLFSDDKKKLKIFKTGHSKNISLFSSRSEELIIIGRVYFPFSLGQGLPDSNSTEIFKHISSCRLSEFQGNYVIIRYNKNTKGVPQLEISTDKFGSRLFLYLEKQGYLLFSSHIHGLKLLLGSTLPSLSEESVIHYYHFGFTANDRSLLEEINKIPPGTTLGVLNEKSYLKTYFHLSEYYSPEDYAAMDEITVSQQLDECLLDAVVRRTPRKKSVAVALSGGVDSGYIVKQLKRSGAEITGYNLNYGKAYSEIDRVEALEREFKIQVIKKKITPEEIIDHFEMANSIGSEPRRFNDAVMMALAKDAAHDGFDSLWDGDGADRLFFGMNRTFQYLKLIKVYELFNNFHLIPLVLFFLKSFKAREFEKIYLLFKNWSKSIPSYPERKLDGIQSYDPDLEKYIFNLAIKKYWDSFRKKIPLKDVILYFTYQSIHMCPEMFFHPPAELQNFFGMAPVSPFWDDRIVRLALSIPSQFKIKKDKPKYILRKAAALGQGSEYWMKSKIGLQSAYNFCLNSSSGQEWKCKRMEPIRESAEYKIIKDHLRTQAISMDRLLVLNFWKERQSIK